MLTISKPLSAGQAHRYHAEEFVNARDNYYTVGDQIRGTWHGRLAAAWGLTGQVDDEAFRRLANGEHPFTGAHLVRHQTPHQSTNAHGDRIHTLEHRAGWDLTFSAPKSVSLTALVGGDAGVREAHQASVSIALDAIEPYVQARLGGTHPAETTGRWIAARFEHDSARPVDGYAAPQLHTHVVVFNLTDTSTDQVRALQPRELYKTQGLATAVYRTELARRLKALGYEIERGISGQPEISGYSQAYLDASSPRRKQIEAHLTAADQHGAAAAQIAAHRTREGKVAGTAADVRQQHQTLAEAFGNQPTLVVSAAQARAQERSTSDVRHYVTAQEAMSFAKERTFERDALVDQRAVLRDALARGMGDVTLDQVRDNLERRIHDGEFLVVPQEASVTQMITTREMVALERDLIKVVRAGHDQHPPLASSDTAQAIERVTPALNPGQRDAVQQILASHDTVIALEGVAGAGKTTALAAVRGAAQQHGYVVEGLAPTSRAAQELAAAGFTATTLQHHLAGQPSGDGSQRRLWVLDEASLAGTRQLHRFLTHLDARDRVVLVGDVRQHQAVEAGRPYYQLQQAGLAVVRLDHIIRQQDPVLREVVDLMARGQMHDAVEALQASGRVSVIVNRDDRLRAIVDDYLRDPTGTLVVAPDHLTRREINRQIHQALQSTRAVATEDVHLLVLVPRGDLSGADRQWAQRYQVGDVIRYIRGSRPFQLRAGAYATVKAVDGPNNVLTVDRDEGVLAYDPRRLQGVTVYRTSELALARGDRVQLTAPDRARHLANRQLGTIEHIEPATQLVIRLDNGRWVRFDLTRPLHLDYGYAVTSHSSQGQTADRVLVHVDTTQHEMLVNRRFAYVATSRGRFDVRVYTDDDRALSNVLAREAVHRSVIERTPTPPTGLAREPTFWDRYVP